MDTANATNPPPNVAVQIFSDRVEYLLPRESDMRKWALFMFAIGVPSFAFAAVRGADGVGGKAIAVGTACLLLGVGAIFVRENIEMLRGQIIANFRVGPLSFRQRTNAHFPHELKIVHGTDKWPEKPGKDAYRVYLGDVRLTGTFPRAWCEALVANLAYHWSRLTGGAVSSVAGITKLGAVPNGDRLPVEINLPPQPASSQVEVQSLAEGVAFSIPRAGWNEHSRSILGLGVLFVASALITLIVWPEYTWQASTAIGLWIIAITVALGIVCIVWAVAFTRRQGGLVLANRRLVFVESGTLFTKHREFNLDDIASITAGQNFWLMKNVQITPGRGQATTFFAGRTDGELDWLVLVLGSILMNEGVKNKPNTDRTAN